MSTRTSSALLRGLLLLAMFAVPAVVFAKDQPIITVMWPDSGNAILRFTFGKFKEVGGIANERSYIIDASAENLWSKPISDATFSLYVFDKNKARIGEGFISISNVGPSQVVKFPVTLASSGLPASLTLIAKSLPKELGPAAPPKKVSITVNSVPQGAALKVDGADAGTTPKIVQLTVGKHILGFNMEGFNPGNFPLEIGPDDAPGGSVSYELAGSAHDTIELRDGTLLSGDLLSLDGAGLTIRVGGAAQHLDRNNVKRILLVEREPAQ